MSQEVFLMNFNFAKLLEDERLKRDISKSELAREIGIDVSTLFRYYKKTAFPKIKNMKKIAYFLQKSIDDLF